MKHFAKVCIVVVILISLGGCRTKKSEEPVSVIPATEEPVTEVPETESSQDGNIITMSENKEPLNVLEDNYRTYYEIFVGSFYDSNQDGIGDIQGIISKLDYINDNDESTDTDLGCNGIWLMPIMPSPTYHKYDVTDYYSVDEQYGTLEDFKQLISECDKRGIKVIIDFIFNHTSSQNPWFIEAVDYVSSLAENDEIDCGVCPYADYYNFSKEKAGKDGWYQIGNTGWYYEAQFTRTMPDLNLDSEAVRTEIEKIAAYWIGLGVGGFRLDAVKEYYSGSNSSNIEVLEWFRNYAKYLDEDCYLVAEVWDSIGTIAQFYESGIDSIFNYYYGSSDGKIPNLVNQIDKNKAGQSLAKVMKSMEDTLSARNAEYIDASFLSNHDNDRCISYVGNDSNKMKLMAGINLCMSGSSFIYYGEEIGMSGSGRDENKRGPMIWSDTNSTGQTTGPVDMESSSTEFGSVELQLQEQQSLLNYYIRAVRLRNENPEIARGTIQIIEGIEDGDLCGVQKSYDGSTITMLYNMSSEQKELDLLQLGITYERIKGALLTDESQPVIQDGVLTLPPYSIIVLK